MREAWVVLVYFPSEIQHSNPASNARSLGSKYNPGEDIGK